MGKAVQSLSLKEFKKEIDALNLDNVSFDVRSQGEGNISLSVHNCNLSVYIESDICGDIIISKPEAGVRIVINDDSLADILKKDDMKYCLDIDFSMFMSDIEITIADNNKK